jgi:adenosylcobinamide-GDP ribazoletransferase
LAPLRACVAALAFLTRIPVGRRVALDGDDVAAAAPAFPLIGAGIGAATGGLAAALAGPLSSLLAAALALALSTLVTGALHLDALADSADALAARTRERALAIMRDHAIGAYGASAIALDLLVKAAALAALAARHQVLAFAIAAGALSRLVPVLLAAALPYARSEGGTGAALAGGRPRRAVLASAVACAIAVAAAGVDGALLAGCAVALALAGALFLRRWLGGVTGDTLGAGLELTETAVLVIAVALAGGAR